MTFRVPVRSFFTIRILVLIASVFIIGIAGYLFYKGEEESIRQRQYAELRAIADLKVQQIVQWNHERRSDAAVISKSAVFTRAVERWIADRTNQSIERDIEQRLRTALDYFRYGEIVLVSPAGEPLLSVGEQHERLETVVLENIRIAIKSRAITFTDLHRCAFGNSIHYDIIAPLINDKDHTVAALLFRRDPSLFLYPLIQSWPTPSKTAETFIVRQEGEHVLFLNEARHQSNTALRLKIPLSKKSNPAIVAVSGYEGMIEGIDYRGAAVLASVHSIPETNWKMVAKIDSEEIFSGLTSAAMIVSGITVLLILLAGTGVSLIYSHRQKGIYQELYTKEKELWQAQEKFKVTLDSLGDGVIITDTKGTISYVNKQAENLTRWRIREARGRSLNEVYRVRNEETGERENNIVEKVLRQGIVKELANHTILISRDGKETPVMDTGAPIYDVDGSIIGLVVTFQDETEKRTQQKLLKLSEQKVRLTLENAGEGIYGLDLEGKATFVNEAAARMLGYTPDELVGQQMHANHHYKKPDGSPYDREDCPIYKAFKEGKTFHVETEVFWRKDGTAFPVRYTSTPSYENGDVLGAVVVFEDITERKRSEEVLKASEERYRLLFNSMVEGFALHEIICDADGKPVDYRFLEVNPAFEPFTGLKASDVIGKTVREVIPLVEQRWIDIYGEVALGGNPFHTETFSTELQRYYTVKAFCPKHGQFGVIFDDVTERKKAEEELARHRTHLEELVKERSEELLLSEARYREIFDLTPISIWEENWADVIEAIRGLHAEGVMDFQSYFRDHPEFVRQMLNAVRIVNVNRATLTMFEAHDKADLLFSLETVFATPDTLPGFVGELLALASGKTIYSTEMALRTVSGKLIHCLLTMSFPNEESCSTIVLVGIMDITERKEAEKRIRELNEDLHRQTLLLEEANAELESFSYSVSHDLRSPLRHIQGYVDMFERIVNGNLSEKGQHYLRTIREASTEMGELIDDLLDFSRTGRKEIHTTVVNLDTLVKEVIGKLEMSTRGRNITWKIEPLPFVLCDQAMIRQVLRNLIENAVKYTKACNPAVIEIASAGEEEGYTIFSIRDNGTGFDMQYAHKLFGVFQRLHSSSEFEGTGIGLAIVRRIITRHGGRTWAEGQPGKGATFYFTLMNALSDLHISNRGSL